MTVLEQNFMETLCNTAVQISVSLGRIARSLENIDERMLYAIMKGEADEQDTQEESC